MGQLLLIPNSRPLEERLGEAFFREAPECPGVYLMKDATDTVLYVGKAKNLRQRIRNYRIADPDRMPRRHLRMLPKVARIEFQFCSDESAALKHESKLLRSLKPRFNRAGVWPGKTRFLVWRQGGEVLEMAVSEVPEPGWHRHGPMGGEARHLYGTLARVLWMAMNPDRPVSDLPEGWAQGRIAEHVLIQCHAATEEVGGTLIAFFWEAEDRLIPWLEAQFVTKTHPFERALIDGELEYLKEFYVRLGQLGKDRSQLCLL